MDHCPRCSYALQGLPQEHHCPECGFEYERDATVIQADRRGWWALAIVSGLLFVVGIVDSMWRGQLSMLTCQGFPAAIAIWRLRQTRAFVVVSRTRVRVFHRDGREEAYPLANIASARWNFVNGHIVIDALDGSRLATIPQKVLVSTRRARIAAREITKYAAVARRADAIDGPGEST